MANGGGAVANSVRQRCRLQTLNSFEIQISDTDKSRRVGARAGGQPLSILPSFGHKNFSFLYVRAGPRVYSIGHNMDARYRIKIMNFLSPRRSCVSSGVRRQKIRGRWFKGSTLVHAPPKWVS